MFYSLILRGSSTRFRTHSPHTVMSYECQTSEIKVNSGIISILTGCTCVCVYIVVYDWDTTDETRLTRLVNRHRKCTLDTRS